MKKKGSIFNDLENLEEEFRKMNTRTLAYLVEELRKKVLLNVWYKIMKAV